MKRPSFLKSRAKAFCLEQQEDCRPERRKSSFLKDAQRRAKLLRLEQQEDYRSVLSKSVENLHDFDKDPDAERWVGEVREDLNIPGREGKPNTCRWKDQFNFSEYKDSAKAEIRLCYQRRRPAEFYYLAGERGGIKKSYLSATESDVEDDFPRKKRRIGVKSQERRLWHWKQTKGKKLRSIIVPRSNVEVTFTRSFHERPDVISPSSGDSSADTLPTVQLATSTKKALRRSGRVKKAKVLESDELDAFASTGTMAKRLNVATTRAPPKTPLAPKGSPRRHTRSGASKRSRSSRCSSGKASSPQETKPRHRPKSSTCPKSRLKKGRQTASGSISCSARNQKYGSLVLEIQIPIMKSNFTLYIIPLCWKDATETSVELSVKANITMARLSLTQTSERIRDSYVIPQCSIVTVKDR
eukprot:g4243.t1